MRGEYNTRQKRDMLAFLTNNNLKHYTLDELTQAMHEEGISAGKTTVYRFVETLAEQGRVRKYQNGSESFYQYIEDDAGCGTHLHLMCRECGALYHVDCELVGELIHHVRDEHNFILDVWRTVLVGVCGECAGRREEGQNGADSAE